MTLAVCIFCGSTKFAALSKCDDCGRQPKGSPEVLAKSIAFTDHNLNDKGLQIVSAMIKQGNDPLTIPELQEEYLSYLKLFTNDKGELDMTQMKEWLASKQNAVTSDSRDNQNSCPDCGRVFDPAEKTCPYCNETPLSLHVNAPNKRKRGFPIVCAALILGGAIGFGYWKHTPGKLEVAAITKNTKTHNFDEQLEQLSFMIGHSTRTDSIGKQIVSPYADLFTAESRKEIINKFNEASRSGNLGEMERILLIHTDEDSLKVAKDLKESRSAAKAAVQRMMENDDLEQEDKTYNNVDYRALDNLPPF